MKNKIIKVAIDCHKLEDATGAHRAGVGRHIYRMLEEISNKPALAENFRFYLYFKGKIPQDIDFLDNPIFIKKIAKLPLFFPFFRPSFNIFFHIALPLYALKDRVNVAFFASFMFPAFYIGKSVLLLTNDVYHEMRNKQQPLKYRIGYRIFATWGAKRATQITTQTNASRQEIAEYFNLDIDKVEVAPLGADISKTKNIEPKENYMLYIGQAFPRRHLKETMLAFEKIAYKFEELKFIAVGVDKYNPPVVDDLAKKINDNLGEERIIRKEYVEDEELIRLYQRAQLFTYISSSEAMGLPPLEALAAGTVPVVADTPTTKEIFETCAFFVEKPDNSDNIAQVLTEALTNKDKKEAILSNRDAVLSKYTWSRHVDLMVDIFKKTVAKRDYEKIS